ncbi:MAG: hypothetical protein LLF76_02275 [Planctomycetaceae bacterium]|nr:hypothetical protein [Planctomycetaceae bacterium]
MMLSLELGPDYQQTLASMEASGNQLSLATSRGLGKAVIFGADHIVKFQLMGQVLKPRTHDLANAVQGWKEEEFVGVIGVQPSSAVEDYKYLLGDGPDFEIKPKTKRLLSIPLDDAQTSAGVLKSEYSAGLLNIDGGFIKEVNDKLFFVKHRGKTERSKLLFLFRLVPSVTAHPTGAMVNGAMIAADGMTEILQNEIANAISD